jgi:rare lipoprotein A
MPVSTEDAPQEKGATLKEPVIPNENLDIKQVSEDSENGTLYETGMATYYSAKTHGRMMANGTRYDKSQLFCAHKKLPFGTRVRVVNKKNGREVIVDVRDRGPFAKGRVIDLSNKAAEILGMLSDGVVPVELWVIDD